MLTLLATVLIAQVPAPSGSPPGRRADIGDGAKLFVPSGYVSPGGVVNVVLHLSGKSADIEPGFVTLGWPAVLIEFDRGKGLSEQYARPFSDPALFPRLLDRAMAEVRKWKLADEPRLGWVVVSSFGAGYGGVRALLREPQHFDRIAAITLIDSIYAGRERIPGEPPGPIIPEHMAEFVRFVREATAGRKSMLVTHTAHTSDSSAAPFWTSSYLIEALSGRAQPFDSKWKKHGLRTTRRFQQGKILILGFTGVTGDDRIKHLRAIGSLWSVLPDWPPAAEAPRL